MYNSSHPAYPEELPGWKGYFGGWLLSRWPKAGCTLRQRGPPIGHEAAKSVHLTLLPFSTNQMKLIIDQAWLLTGKAPG